jgi:phosphate transport system protein
MGALALHVAKVARRQHPASAVPNDVSGYLAEMGRIAGHLGEDTKDGVLSQNPAKAQQLEDDDSAMDDIHRHLFAIVTADRWTHGTATAVDVTLLSRYHERFADHAVDIGRRVIYQMTSTSST